MKHLEISKVTPKTDLSDLAIQLVGGLKKVLVGATDIMFFPHTIHVYFPNGDRVVLNVDVAFVDHLE